MAWAWFSGVDPAQQSASTRTCAPASAAGRAVAMTQQSVDTPASAIRGCSPMIARRSAFHLPKVGAVMT